MEQVTIPTAQLYYKWERKGQKRIPRLNGRVRTSIAERGVVNPLIVTHANGKVYVWIGNQRLAASRALGIEQVDCIVVESAEEVAEALGSYKEV